MVLCNNYFVQEHERPVCLMVFFFFFLSLENQQVLFLPQVKATSVQLLHPDPKMPDSGASRYHPLVLGKLFAFLNSHNYVR